MSIARPILSVSCRSAIILLCVISLCGFTLTDDNTRVRNGNELVLQGTRVRLLGIDAPQISQRCRDANDRNYWCGKAAKVYLEGLVAGRIVSCDVQYSDVDGRPVATCSAEGADIGEAMVRAGHALRHVRSSSAAYADAEAEARRERRGLWQGKFQRPTILRWFSAGR